jgi:hypothetical protein
MNEFYFTFVCVGRRDFVSIKSKFDSVGPSLAVTDLSLPHLPRRVRSAGRRDLVSVRSKFGSVGPGLTVIDLSLPHPPHRVFVHLVRCFTGLSLPHPPCRAQSTGRQDLVSVLECRVGSSCNRPLPPPPPKTFVTYCLN